MIIRARTVVTMDGPPIHDGAVAIEGNRVRAVGAFHEIAPRGGEVLDLGEQILMPGLINAHCHLDYTMMRRAIAPPKSFTAGCSGSMRSSAASTVPIICRAIARGFTELQQWGTTSVCNIEAFPELMPRLPPSPIRTWWFYEMIDVRHRVTTDDVVAGALSFFHHRGNTLDHFGLSPHAPYTASVELYQLANNCASSFTMPLTTHVGESVEEFSMFREARGPLYEFMESIQRPMDDCGSVTPFAHLWESGAVHGGWILAHMNELAKGDFALLASLPRGSAPHVVHCPSSHRYFAHRVFEWQRLQELGVNLSVGTDSLASTDSLSLLGELRQLQRTEPSLSPEQLLRTITTNPARALQRSHQLGRLVPGALADMIALPGSGNAATALEEIVAFEQPIPWMMIDGEHRA
jgi:cytosine/adenosine deaminase-related metal-dependent hydrolase